MKTELIEKIIEKYLLEWTENKTESESVFIWKYVILRCRNAGVHFGKLEYANNWVYRLSESRRLYRWRIKNKNWVSLSELSLYWLDKEYSKINETIQLIEITEREWWEIIPVLDNNIINNFKNFKTYIPE